jgi:hypothetical protein
MKKVFLSLFIFLISLNVFAQCPTGTNELIIQIVPDGWPSETSWNVSDLNGNILSTGASAGDTVCVPSNTCLQFSIFDTYGDGINPPGGYWVYLDGTLITSGNSFGFTAQYQFNCGPGTFCSNAGMITPGTYTATHDDHWYKYIPSVSGTYNLSTCSLNTCDTKIWVYNYCPNLPYSELAPGSFAFNDDFCGSQAQLDVVLMGGTTYYFRIGDNMNGCSTSIDFTFSFIGAISGCTDPLACNYYPLATVDDSSCIYYPDPNCSGPDLEFDSLAFMQNLGLTTHPASSCDVDEGCVTGYGTRYVIEFTSKINNIGTLDYYIGNNSTQPGMFNTNNCHGHAHYEGYGDYRLFSMNGDLVPAGHKNGYCVIDLCGFGQYTCSNMGISVGCYDAYGAGTQCQWIDITDVPDGDYRLAVIINSQHLPDAYGHYETNTINNALQICINIVRNTAGVPSFTVLPTCTPYVDCMGIPGGTAENDCNGVCNGPSRFGDTYTDNAIDDQDIVTYLDLIQSQMPATLCNDLNGNGILSVYDATLANWCRFGNPTHPGGSQLNHCDFPRNILNPNDNVGLGIHAVNFTNNYIDIDLLSTTANIKAYQFTITGATISSVVSLADPVEFPVDLRYIAGSNEVVAISVEDSTILRNNNPQPLLRIYYSAITDTAICISTITDIVNQNAERVMTNVFGGCVQTSTTGLQSVLSPADLAIYPNPAKGKTYVHLSNASLKTDEILVQNISGQFLSTSFTKMNDNWYELDLHSLPAGIYLLSVRNAEVSGTIRFVVLD